MATYTYSIGEIIEIEVDGKSFEACVTDLAPGQMVVKINDKRAGDLQGTYLKLGRAS